MKISKKVLMLSHIVHAHFVLGIGPGPPILPMSLDNEPILRYKRAGRPAASSASGGMSAPLRLNDKFDGSAVDQPPHPVHGHDIAVLQGREEVRHPDDAG